jgi:outer membrane lipoprotein SlyB
MNVERGFAVAALLALAACTTLPTGPSVTVLPGTGKTFDQFRLDDMDCRQYSAAQSGGKTANDTATDSTVKSGALGALLGGVAGAAIGGNSRGAAVGAGVGVLGGSVAGSEAGRASGSEVQRRYDNAYIQCMYAKGHRVPLSGQYGGTVEQPAAATPPPPPPR